MKIDRRTIDNMDLSRYRHLSGMNAEEFYGRAGEQHYRLLAALSTRFDGEVIVDIGTHKGFSAAALSYNPSNVVYSFDVEDRVEGGPSSPKTLSSVRFIQADVLTESSRAPWADILLHSRLIFLDIDPHEGILEYQFYRWLQERHYRGVVIFDDIGHFEGMKRNLWGRIEAGSKQDITHLGHWSGTGVVQFQPVFQFEEAPARPARKKALAVTGFVANAFPARHLSEQQARAYGERLKACIPGRLQAFDVGWTLADCWAHPLYVENPGLMPSDANPPLDRFAEPRHAALSNIVLLQRFEWMRLAAQMHPDVEVFAWIEYTVLKQRNVSEAVIQGFMDALEVKTFDAISLPGCWDKSPIDDSRAHWRFCGSVWVCPRQYVERLAEAVKTVATLRTRMTGKISWDMNTMAYVELLDMLPIRWYPGNHDETQFTNF